MEKLVTVSALVIVVTMEIFAKTTSTSVPMTTTTTAQHIMTAQTQMATTLAPARLDLQPELMTLMVTPHAPALKAMDMMLLQELALHVCTRMQMQLIMESVSMLNALPINLSRTVPASQSHSPLMMVQIVKTAQMVKYLLTQNRSNATR